MKRMSMEKRPSGFGSPWSRRAFVLATCLAAGGMTFACKSRSEVWDAGVGTTEPIGLTGSVAVMDESLDRVVFLTSPKNLALETTSFPVGLNVINVQRSADLSQLYVLSRGEYPRTESDDEKPKFIVFDGGLEPKELKTFELDDPMQQLAIDPRGEWVVAFDGDATVTNANELVFLQITGDSETPKPKTIRSFGGAPVEIIFTDELTVPQGGARRFVVVRTDRDVTIIDLENLDAQEVTVPMPETDDKIAIKPLQIVFDEGDPERLDDSRLAVRLSKSSDVVLLQLGESDKPGKDFAVVPNIVDVGGVPSTIDFVHTDGGLRLAALIPDRQRATLVNPETTLAESVDLPHRFDQMTRITSLVNDASTEDGDVALLWGSSTQIAFWSLGATSATPYRSVDSTELDVQISKVLDVPPPNQHLKVLVTPGNSGFFVLDLLKRESFPLTTEGQGFDTEVSPDGARLWVTRPGSEEFSAVRLDNLHPAALFVTPGVNGVFDIARADDGRAAIAFHNEDGWAATILDAEKPDSANTAYFPALELEGLQ